MASEDIANFMGLLETFYRHDSVNPKKNRDFSYHHPSAVGGCSRAECYKYYGELKINGMELPSEELEGSKVRLFNLGHSLHAELQNYFVEKNIARGYFECSNKLCKLWDENGVFRDDPIKREELIKSNHYGRIFGKENKIGIKKPEKCKCCGNKTFFYHEIQVLDRDYGLNLKGNADMVVDLSDFNPDIFNDGKKVAQMFDIKYLSKTPFIVDFKTCGSRKFKTLKDLPNDRSGRGQSGMYRSQMQLYMQLLDLPSAVLLYYEKDTSEFFPFIIDRNEEDWNQLKKQLEMMNRMYASNPPKLAPPKYESDSYHCRYCDFRSKCHESPIWQNPKLQDIQKNFYGHLLEEGH